MRTVILNDVSLARGGATGLALRQATLFTRAGREVVFVTGDAGDAPELRAAGVRIVALGQVPLLDLPKAEALRRGLVNPVARDRVARLIAEEDRPGTTYHLHGWARILSPAVLSALGPVARRTVLHAHDLFLACPNGVFFEFPTGTVCTRRPLSLSCLATNCDKRSRVQKDWRSLRQVLVRHRLRAHPWGAVALIHPAMRDEFRRSGLGSLALEVHRNPARAWTEARIPAEANARVFYAGRLVPGKGVGMLCEAARAAGLELDIVGDGPRRAALAAAYPEVRLHGWQDRAGLARIAAGARVAVMPSRFPEPFGLVAAEASRSGLPVIAPDGSPIGRDVADKALGWTFARGDTGDLTRALCAAAGADAATIRAISQRGHAAEDPLAQSEADWSAGLLALHDRLAGA
jgi:glycosyltransferase involved in cell wall biosynthesis